MYPRSLQDNGALRHRCLFCSLAVLCVSVCEAVLADGWDVLPCVLPTQNDVQYVLFPTDDHGEMAAVLCLHHAALQEYKQSKCRQIHSKMLLERLYLLMTFSKNHNSVRNLCCISGYLSQYFLWRCFLGVHFVNSKLEKRLVSLQTKSKVICNEQITNGHFYSVVLSPVVKESACAVLYLCVCLCFFLSLWFEKLQSDQVYYKGRLKGISLFCMNCCWFIA